MADLTDSSRGLVRRFQASVPWRAWQRYNDARGNVLAGGMAFIAFFSLGPALAVGFTAFGLIVGHDPELEARVVEAVNDAVGTTFITPAGHASGGIISIDQLTARRSLTLTAFVGLVGFLLTGLSWLDAMREGIRAMFGRPVLSGGFVRTKLRDMAALVSIGLVLLLSAAGGVVVSGATGGLLDLVGLGESTVGRILIGAASTLVLLGVDLLMFLVLFRLLSGVRVPNHDLWDAALFGALGLGLAKLFAGFLLKRLTDQPLLATAGVVLGVLVWLNLVSRLTLVAAAWGATMASDRGHLPPSGSGEPSGSDVVDLTGTASAPVARPAGAVAGPASGAGSEGKPLTASFTPVVSPRGADRVSVAAGVVLGAASLIALRTSFGAVRSAASALRSAAD